MLAIYARHNLPAFTRIQYAYMVSRSQHNAHAVRVLIVDHTAKLGGGEIALRNLLNHLDLDRVSPSVLLFAEGPLADQLRERFPVHILPLSSRVAETRKGSVGWKSLVRVGDLFATASFVFRLARFIKRSDAELVHTNSLKSHVLGGIAARLAGRRVIWHMRDRIAPDYLPKPAVALIRFLSKIVPHFVIANSRATLRTIRDLDRHPSTAERHYRVVHDGCEVPSAIAFTQTLSPVRVGLIGRISPWKGQHVFIKAAALLREEFPQVQFQIIGAPLFSETDYESELKDLRRRLHLEDTVEFTGFLEDVPSALAKLEIVVHASTTGEPFGQVVIEAMAAGKPVIATNGGGIPEIVVDGVTGLLVPMGDERSLAAAIGRLLRDPAAAHQMGLRGRERVSELFTLSRCARAVEEVYSVMRVDRHSGLQKNAIEADAVGTSL